MSSRTAPLISPGTLSTPRAVHPGLHPIAEKVKEQISPREWLEQGLENVTPYLQNHGGFAYAVLIRNCVFFETISLLLSFCEHKLDRTGADRKWRNLLPPTFVGTCTSLPGRIVSLSLRMTEMGGTSVHSGESTLLQTL